TPRQQRVGAGVGVPAASSEVEAGGPAGDGVRGDRQGQKHGLEDGERHGTPEARILPSSARLQWIYLRRQGIVTPRRTTPIVGAAGAIPCEAISSWGWGSCSRGAPSSLPSSG